MTHYHFMGIGGIGMSGIAQVLLESGHQVSGCDLAPSELAYRLEARGATVFRGHDPAHVEVGFDTLVISTAIPDDHPEVLAALTAGKRVIRRIELLGELLDAKDSIGVVGTHGKTSTTSMIATVFERAGLSPTAIVGGEVGDIGGNAKLGTGPHLIAEIDESDTKFQNLAVKTAVITNVEDDHVATPGEARLNYHASREALEDAFRRFAAKAERVVYCHDWPGLREIVSACPHLVSYGTVEEADYRAVDIDLRGGQAAYTLVANGQDFGRVRLLVPGMHSVLNSLGALAAADGERVPLEAAIAAIGTFRGAHRRWERVGELNGALIVDDYAHNPTKVAAALAGAKTTGRRVRIVFQPHRFLRTAREWERFADVLMPADDVLVVDIYGAGEQEIPGVHASRIAERMAAAGHPSVNYYPDREALIGHLLESAAPGEVIVTMGAGDVWKVGTRLAAVAQGVGSDRA